MRCGGGRRARARPAPRGSIADGGIAGRISSRTATPSSSGGPPFVGQIEFATPVLIMHGTADQDMPIEHSQRMAAELNRLGRTHRLLLFEGQQHRIGGRGVDCDAAAIEWFRCFKWRLSCPFEGSRHAPRSAAPGEKGEGEQAVARVDALATRPCSDCGTGDAAGSRQCAGALWDIPYLQDGTRIEQLFDDLQMIGSRFVDGRPDCRSECCAAIHASRFERSLCADEEPHRFQLSTIRCPVEGVQTGARPSRGIDALLQQVLRDARAARKLAHVSASASAFG